MTQLDDFKRQIPPELQNNGRNSITISRGPELTSVPNLRSCPPAHTLRRARRARASPTLPRPDGTDQKHRHPLPHPPPPHLLPCREILVRPYILPPAVLIHRFPFLLDVPANDPRLATLFKLATLNEPRWDRALARSTVESLQIFHRYIERIEVASWACRLINDHPEGDVFTRAVKLAKRMGQFWEARMVAAGVVSVSVDAAAVTRTPGGGGSGSRRESGLLEGVMDYHGVPDTFHMDWFDAACMSKFLGVLDS